MGEALTLLVPDPTLHCRLSIRFSLARHSGTRTGKEANAVRLLPQCEDWAPRNHARMGRLSPEPKPTERLPASSSKSTTWSLPELYQLRSAWARGVHPSPPYPPKPTALGKRGRRAGGRRSTLQRPDPAGRPSPWRWRWRCRCGPGNVKRAHELAATDRQLGGGLRACALVPEGPRGALRAPRSGPEGSRPVGRLGRTGGSGIWPGFGPSPGAA